MIPPLEIYTVKHGEDRLAKITARRIGEMISRSWLVPSAKAEDVVLEAWEAPRCAARFRAELVTMTGYVQPIPPASRTPASRSLAS